MVPANRSSHVSISALSAAVGSSGYKDAIEWSVIHPNGPQMDVITLSKEIVENLPHAQGSRVKDINQLSHHFTLMYPVYMSVLTDANVEVIRWKLFHMRFNCRGGM